MGGETQRKRLQNSPIQRQTCEPAKLSKFLKLRKFIKNGTSEILIVYL